MGLLDSCICIDYPYSCIGLVSGSVKAVRVDQKKAKKKVRTTRSNLKKYMKQGGCGETFRNRVANFVLEDHGGAACMAPWEDQEFQSQARPFDSPHVFEVFEGNEFVKTRYHQMLNKCFSDMSLEMEERYGKITAKMTKDGGGAVYVVSSWSEQPLTRLNNVRIVLGKVCLAIRFYSPRPLRPRALMALRPYGLVPLWPHSLMAPCRHDTRMDR